MKQRKIRHKSVNSYISVRRRGKSMKVHKEYVMERTPKYYDFLSGALMILIIALLIYMGKPLYF